MSLSDKIKTNEDWKPHSEFSFYWETDVAEAVKELKEAYCRCHWKSQSKGKCYMCMKLLEIFGAKLSSSQKELEDIQNHFYKANHAEVDSPQDSSDGLVSSGLVEPADTDSQKEKIAFKKGRLDGIKWAYEQIEKEKK